MPTHPTPRPSDVHLVHPDWSNDATIYQINTRQFTPEGTFVAATSQLPRLATLGVQILWLMPVHEIGEQNRKGTLGSPYAVKDYYSVNPELGTLAELRGFLDAAHALGLHVILDWVANHTAWDNPLVEQHPEWYARDWKGDLQPSPWWDWPDIVDLDYAKPGLRSYMTEAMAYWVREVGFDGFRCDVAGFVPTDWWEVTRAELERIRPVFLLAEWESRELHDRAFDATYGWSWNEAMHRIASGKADVGALRAYYAWNEKAFQADCLRMLFVSNHDKNAWEGTEFEQFGDALHAAIVLSVVSEGIPLIYNGQEAGSTKRLQFFERDPIAWTEHPLGDLYARLVALKRANHALWNGRWGGRMVEVVTDRTETSLAFVRRQGDHAVLLVLNLCAEPAELTLLDGPYPGVWDDVDSGEQVRLGDHATLGLAAWGYRLLVQGPQTVGVTRG
ncbi:alpha-amylase family glycosyl hydrolase [Actinotalea sp.]|uniref:alpha-amylase family glycosyl hydrolase n=1 Tax=Actinotalea sp. TaxID=1872145 RepID=UPI002B8A245C|nr:alpha-amylase family glycosyl hydrolase [Actinotalea sp.]HRA51683.1 alpha-amylase family glycosyl hydrolase [Actinotalea sp.]